MKSNDKYRLIVWLDILLVTLLIIFSVGISLILYYHMEGDYDTKLKSIMWIAIISVSLILIIGINGIALGRKIDQYDKNPQVKKINNFNTSKKVTVKAPVDYSTENWHISEEGQ